MLSTQTLGVLDFKRKVRKFCIILAAMMTVLLKEELLEDRTALI